MNLQGINQSRCIMSEQTINNVVLSSVKISFSCAKCGRHLSDFDPRDISNNFYVDTEEMKLAINIDKKLLQKALEEKGEYFKDGRYQCDYFCEND